MPSVETLCVVSPGLLIIGIGVVDDAYLLDLGNRLTQFLDIRIGAGSLMNRFGSCALH